MEFDIVTSFNSLSRQVTDLSEQVEALTARTTTSLFVLGALLVLVALKLFLDHRRLAVNQVNLARNLEEFKEAPGKEQ